jgi:hypothetical protein
MWKRFLHLLFMAMLVAGNAGFLSRCCAADPDCDTPLPAEPAEEECESANEIELDKFHTSVAYVPQKAAIDRRQWQWNVRSLGYTQLAECSHGVIGIRGPPVA